MINFLKNIFNKDTKPDSAPSQAGEIERVFEHPNGLVMIVDQHNNFVGFKDLDKQDKGEPPQQP